MVVVIAHSVLKLIHNHVDVKYTLTPRIKNVKSAFFMKK